MVRVLWSYSSLKDAFQVRGNLRDSYKPAPLSYHVRLRKHRCHLGSQYRQSTVPLSTSPASRCIRSFWFFTRILHACTHLRESSSVVVNVKSGPEWKRPPSASSPAQNALCSKHLPDTCCCNLGSIDRLPPRERISPWSRRDVGYPQSILRWRFRISFPTWPRIDTRNDQLDFGSDKNPFSLVNSGEPFAKGETPGLPLSMSSDSGSARAISLEPVACGYTRVRTRKEYADATLQNEGRGLSCMPRERQGKGQRRMRSIYSELAGWLTSCLHSLSPTKCPFSMKLIRNETKRNDRAMALFFNDDFGRILILGISYKKSGMIIVINLWLFTYHEVPEVTLFYPNG